MEIYQPMLFVGLGGTGCRVGAELEKRLREELCGPDGTWLVDKLKGQPFELPRCLQFVYADLSASELTKVRREVVPGREHDAAAQKTMRMIADLVPPRMSNSADVAQNLRLHLDDYEIGWLPSKESDPRVGPLVRGAGQLPTVGRAVLFETLRRDPQTATRALEQALGDINESGGALQVISGGNRAPQTDPIVFVVFSVAGGTGSGIFYDYLHLIANIMQRGSKQAEIYPLVLMPSSFDAGQGGGRPAELNAGSSLIDLFRLVDDQNAQAADKKVGRRSFDGAVSVHYPKLGQIGINASTIQTAFLFGRPVGGVKRDDLNRSMVSLMVSLIGGSPTNQDEDDTQHQSFADTFINSAVDRHTVAEAGIGRRSVTTSAVAALTTPLLEITDIISSRLLARAVAALQEVPGALESNRDHIRQFISRSKLDMMLSAAPAGLPAEGNPVGFNAVMEALATRARAMSDNIAVGQPRLNEAVAKQALQFDPRDAFSVVLGEVDLFRARRVALGHPDMSNPIDRGGFAAFLESWRVPPDAPAPQFIIAQPPPPQGVQKRLTTRLRMSDEAVQNAMRQQDIWYGWRTRQQYNTAWNNCQRQWKQVWELFTEQLRGINDAFEAFSRAEPQQFDERSKDLYKPRVGVSYLLPPEDGGLSGFYRTVLDRLKLDYNQQIGLPNPHEGHVLNVLLAEGGRAGWQNAYEAGLQDGPDAAIAVVRQAIKEAVTRRLRPASDSGRPALIPRMRDLLTNASGRREKNVTESDIDRFRQKLAELVPGGFTPGGTGGLRALFTYPAAQRDSDLERMLSRDVALPRDLEGEPEWRAVRGESDSIVVVLNRSAMGVTEVPELRHVVQTWSQAQRRPQALDSLPWRRRLSQDTNYLLMNVEDRREVLHRMLCAAWAGKLVVDSPNRQDSASPSDVHVEIGVSKDAVQMALELSSLGDMSSWATLLQAYESWILIDDRHTRRALASRLMGMQPTDPNSPRPPGPVFRTIVGLAEEEREKVAKAAETRVLADDPQLTLFREFWVELLPGALDKPLTGSRKSLRDLLEQLDITGSGS
ncbi:tubulin-like doman-containing protein [Pseudonocardia lacus]|uniref:tubulin-like doman-containing protein n=1 Tax=Pseudonocardia lacus TaxID=2835865 RepID=UPI001BDBB223|nr:tubulin-like doman-containing protein [Pseudonocardia lacus]